MICAVLLMKKNYLQYVMGYHNAFLVSHIMGSNLLVRISVFQCDWENKMPEKKYCIKIRMIRSCYHIVKQQARIKVIFRSGPNHNVFFFYG